MNTSELIQHLQQVEAAHGSLPVHLEVNVTGLDLLGEFGRIHESYNRAPVQKCEVDMPSPPDYPEKTVWLSATIEHKDEP